MSLPEIFTENLLLEFNLKILVLKNNKYFATAKEFRRGFVPIASKPALNKVNIHLLHSLPSFLKAFNVA
jgi:hypothetical protein